MQLVSRTIIFKLSLSILNEFTSQLFRFFVVYIYIVNIAEISLLLFAIIKFNI